MDFQEFKHPDFHSRWCVLWTINVSIENSNYISTSFYFHKIKKHLLQFWLIVKKLKSPDLRIKIHRVGNTVFKYTFSNGLKNYVFSSKSKLNQIIDKYRFIRGHKIFSLFKCYEFGNYFSLVIKCLLQNQSSKYGNLLSFQRNNEAIVGNTELNFHFSALTSQIWIDFHFTMWRCVRRRKKKL